MLCRVDPLVVESKSRCMRKNHSLRVPQEEAARRQKQLSSRHLLQAGGRGCVASKFPPITDSTGRAPRCRRGRKQVSSLLLLQAGGQSCVAFKFPPITGSTEEATRRRRGERRKQVSPQLLLQAGGQSCATFNFPSITGSTEKTTLGRRGRKRSSSLHLLSRGEKSIAAPTRVVCRASVDLSSQPPGTAAGCGSSLAWWNRLTTTLSGAPGLLS